MKRRGGSLQEQGHHDRCTRSLSRSAYQSQQSFRWWMLATFIGCQGYHAAAFAGEVASLKHRSQTAMSQSSTAKSGGGFLGPAPAPVLASAPMQMPPPPPVIPVMDEVQCKVLEEAILLDPRPTCQHARFASNWDGCSCQIPLPSSINPLPDNLYNPFVQAFPPDPSIPSFPALPTMPPPSNPLQTFVAPMMIPGCPFASKCLTPDDFDCVGFNSFGFSEVSKANFAPASAFLNSISCSYIMKPYDRFIIPKKVQAMQRLRVKLAKAEDHYNEELSYVCNGNNITMPWGKFCLNTTSQAMPCTTPWLAIWGVKCGSTMPKPPNGFFRTSTIQDMCPFECSFKPGMLKWPPEANKTK